MMKDIIGLVLCDFRTDRVEVHVQADYCNGMAMIYRGKTIAMGTPDELKRKMQDEEHPNPSMSDVFIRLVEESDMEVST